MRRVIVILLPLIFVFIAGCTVQQGSTKPIPEAINNSDVMPGDIVAVLNAREYGEINSGYTNVLNAVELPGSMSISIPHIDMSKVHDTNALEQLQIDNLKSHGYSADKISSMDAGDYNRIEQTWTISKSDIALYKSFFPELENADISNWTYGDYLAYDEAAAANVYAPTAEQAAALKARNITLGDARTLLKDFYSYDKILKQSDDILKEYIEGYYQFALDYIKQLAEISERSE